MMREITKIPRLLTGHGGKIRYKKTKPVLELARLSEDMANLNFDAKYTSGGKNEIGVLGENFNKNKSFIVYLSHIITDKQTDR